MLNQERLWIAIGINLGSFFFFTTVGDGSGATISGTVGILLLCLDFIYKGKKQ